MRAFAYFVTTLYSLTDCVETDTRNALQRTCPVCNNLFQDKSELCDRRPLVACVNGDTICADCCNECRKRPDEKCPTCGKDLLPMPFVNKELMKLIENCTSLLVIPDKHIQMQMDPFDRGAFGEVYEATWRQHVVIKIITALDEEEAVKREANITLRLNHPNVIKLFGITYPKRRQLGRQLGIVMEKAEHGSLNKWIGKVDHVKLTNIAVGIIDGLQYIHSQHVIHRDIKPNNILMCGPKDDMIPKITDFGVWATTQVGEGGDLYVAPEARMTFKYESPADVYSLAMMLFEMFNGKLVRESSDEVKHFIMDVHRGIISKIPENFKVPVYLRNVIERGFNENPEKRPELHEYRTVLSS